MLTNALIDEKSPYLRQHSHNPVNWLPWGEAAFEKARSEDKPIFLSVGYSTCHWCHVMAHESFEDERVAAVLNDSFVSVKVDREERPDVDRIYMLFVQAATGSGGWPMSVWLTPDLKPFFGGTYFPPDSRYGRPGFLDLLKHLAQSWGRDRLRIDASSAAVIEQLKDLTNPTKVAQEVDHDLFESAFPQLRRMFDKRWGGFGSAPKFPRPVTTNYLLRYFADTGDTEALDMVLETLRCMANGGMHDHLGGGFHRYSVDERWFVPHFEKMLYDQAQLAISYLEAKQISGDELFASVAQGIFSYVLRDLTDNKTGAFFSAEDADSPDPDHPDHSREGAFYVWTQKEIDNVLTDPEEERLFSSEYGIRPDGNVDDDPHNEFQGRNILNQTSSRTERSSLLESAKQKLLLERSRRPRPHLDSKVLTSWNGLMISALVKGYLVLGEKNYLDAAERAMAFLLTTMYREDSGLLLRRFCDGDAAIPAFLDDYAFFGQALVDLFEATGKALYLKTAIGIAAIGFTQFEDHNEGGFFSTTAHSADLVLRVKDEYDGAEPSGNSVATDVLLRLAHLTGSAELQRRAERSLRNFTPRIKAQPTAAPQMLVAVGRFLAAPEQVVIRCAELSADVENRLRTEGAEFKPWSAILVITNEAASELQEFTPFLSSLELKDRITLYRCKNFVCELPEQVE